VIGRLVLALAAVAVLPAPQWAHAEPGAAPRTCGQELRSVEKQRRGVVAELAKTNRRLRQLGAEMQGHHVELRKLWGRFAPYEARWQQVRAVLNRLLAQSRDATRRIQQLQYRLRMLHPRSPQAHQIRAQIRSLLVSRQRLDQQRRRGEPEYFRLRRLLSPVWRSVSRVHQKLRIIGAEVHRTVRRRNRQAGAWQQLVARLRGLHDPRRHKRCKLAERRKAKQELKQAQKVQSELVALQKELEALDRKHQSTARRASELLSKLPDPRSQKP
jgi:chromosome segregation ATPase